MGQMVTIITSFFIPPFRLSHAASKRSTLRVLAQ